MARWDRIYLHKVKKARLKMWMYDRYIDDSNQNAGKIPPLTKYNVQSGKLAIDESQNPDEEAEERRSRFLKEVADSVHPGIVMDIEIQTKILNQSSPYLTWKSG